MNRPRAICLAPCLAAAMQASAAPPAPVQAASAPTLRHPARPIASRAQLDACLRDTPASASPLDALTAAGRQRFLASLTSTGQGLAATVAGGTGAQPCGAWRRRLAEVGLPHPSGRSRS
ncbi:MAG TPA: hypothetical protein VGU03_09570 [Frateuria sp.]|uniref:hypothetical protein n=1 Tax=Frateuria sp. TaxID=2211372 RepID=UPI002DE983AD|nr:hypothetical protein [Frateuria sp.]